ncbi:MAG: hypothetical protein AVDCRST_MAG88-4130, partial [uncultured Thermomicrobiales bacterium]
IAPAQSAPGRRLRPPDRPGRAAATPRIGVSRLRPQPLRAAGRVRRRTRAGRAFDDDGTGRRAAALPLLPPHRTLRAEPARRLSPGALWGAGLGARALRGGERRDARRATGAGSRDAGAIPPRRGRWRQPRRSGNRGAAI